MMPAREMPVAANVNPSLVWCPHPLLATAGRKTYSENFQPGESVGAYLDRLGIYFGAQPVILCVNGHAVLPEHWYDVMPHSGDLITVRAMVQKGGGGSNVIATILSIVVMIFAPYAAVAMLGAETAGAVGALTLTGSILSGVISIAGNLLINAMFAPPKADLSNAQTATAAAVSPTYSLEGGSNAARLYQPLQLALGEHRMFPDYGAKVYSEFKGQDQYLYQVFHFGISHTNFTLALSDFRIGDTPITDFTDVETQVSDDTGALTLFPSNVDTTSGGSLTVAAGWITRTSSVNTTALAFQVEGVMYAATQGGLGIIAVEFAMQYRRVGDTTWIALADRTEYDDWGGDSYWGYTMPADNTLIATRTRDPIRRTYRVEVAIGQYETRMQRITPEYTADGQQADLVWSQLRSYQPDTGTYTGQRRVALKIKASGQISGTVSQFSALATRSVRVWNGSAWVTQYSSNPAFNLLAALRGGFVAGKRVWGCGLSEDRIDLDSILDFAAWCDSKSLTYDAIIDQRMNCYDMLNGIARCGRGSVSFASGKYGVVWDAPDQPVMQVFGLGNIISGTFSVKWVSEKLGDEIVLSYWNKDNNWAQDTIRVTVPGVTTPVNPVNVELFGCVHTDMAGREANLIAAAQVYRRRFITFESDFEGQVVTRGDVVSISHDVFAAEALNNWGYSGRLISGTTTVLHLDREVVMDAGNTNYLCLRYPDNTIVTREVNYASGNVSTITLATALPNSPNSDSYNAPMDYVWLFGLNADGAALKCKVHDVTPLQGAKDVRITLVDENPDYYASESGVVYNPPTKAGSNAPTISDIAFSESLTQQGGGVATKVTAIWDTHGEYDSAHVRAFINGFQTVDTTALTNSITFDAPHDADILVEVLPRDAAGRAGAKVAGAHTMALLASDPADVRWVVADDGTAQSGPINVYGSDSPMAAHAQTAAETALRLLLKADELKTRAQYEKFVTDATVTVDPSTGIVSLLATASVTTDVEAHLHSVDITLNAVDATVITHTSTLNNYGDRITAAEGSISVLEGAVSLKASSTYVDTQIADALGVVDPEVIRAAQQTGAEGLLQALLDGANSRFGVQAAVVNIAAAETLLNTTAEAGRAEAVARTVVATQVADNLAAAAVQFRALSLADSAMAQSITSLQAATGLNAADITAMGIAYTNADTAIAGSVTTLSGRVTTVEGGITTNAADIVTEAGLRVDGDSANADLITAVSARLDSGDFATVKTVANAAATASGTNATNITTVTTRLDAGDFASVKTSASASAGAITGLNAQYVIKVDTNGHGAGIQLASGSGGSSIAMLADKYLWLLPDGTGTPKQFFVAGNVNGVATLGLKGDFLVDGSVQARSIYAAYLSAISADLGSINAGSINIGGGSAIINGDGSAYFDNITVSRNLAAASGEASAFAGSYAIIAADGYKKLATVSIDTGYSPGAWWSANDKTFQATCGLQYSGGKVTAHYFYSLGTFTAQWAFKVVNAYTLSGWSGASSIILEVELWAIVDGDIYQLDFLAPSWKLFKVT